MKYIISLILIISFLPFIGFAKSSKKTVKKITSKQKIKRKLSNVSNTKEMSLRNKVRDRLDTMVDINKSGYAIKDLIIYCSNKKYSCEDDTYNFIVKKLVLLDSKDDSGHNDTYGLIASTYLEPKNKDFKKRIKLAVERFKSSSIKGNLKVATDFENGLKGEIDISNDSGN